MPVRVPGQAPIDYVIRDLDRPLPLVTTAHMKDGSQQVHVAGGLSTHEFMALEIAKSAARSGCDVEAIKLGEWAVAVAETILLKCAELEEPVAGRNGSPILQ
jgi:hypothetical protein